MANSDPEEDISELLDILSKKQLADVLVESLPRDQIAGILLSAAGADPSIRSNVRCAVDADPSLRELFVSGLGLYTTEASLRLCFSPFGEIESVSVPVGDYGQSKRYGFVLFRHLASAKKALRQPFKPVLGQLPTVFCSHTVSARKVFVRNLPPGFDGLTRLKEFFTRFGEIEDGRIVDPGPGQPRTDAYFVYRTLEGAVRASVEPTKNFEGNILVCEREFAGRSTVPQPH